MNREQLRFLLAALVERPGVSGHEQEVAAWLARAAAPLADAVWHDPFGNLVAERRAGRPGAPRLVLAAHMDTVGLVIRHVEEDGFLRFEKLGGTDDRLLLGRGVIIGTGAGPVRGVIGVRPYHLHRGRERRAPGHEKMYIDAGAASAAEARALGIRPGDPVAFSGTLQGLGAHRVAGPGLDDRAGCALLIALLQAVAGVPLPVDLCAVFTVQEELGTRGARFLAHRLAADAALVVDTAVAEDTPELAERGGLRLGRGPGIKRMDAALVAHPRVWQRLEALAARLGLPHQPEIGQVGATDGRDLQLAAPTGGLSIPCRYTHSPHEVVDLRDLEAALALLAEAVRAPI